MGHFILEAFNKILKAKDGTLAISANRLNTSWKRWRDSIASLC